MDEIIINTLADNILFNVENFEEVNLEFFVKNISDIIIDALNLRGYVSDVKLEDSYAENPSSRGVFDGEGNVRVFRAGIEQALNDTLQNISGLSEYEIKLYRCLLYTKTIIHELEHVNQKKSLIEDKENSLFETLITRLCESNKRPVAYYCMYDSYPAERLAELKAFRTATRIIECLETKCDITLLSCYFKKQAILEEFYNYYKYGPSGSTECYFDFWDRKALSVLKAEKEKKELKLEDRVLYGLEISRGEYEGMVLQYAELDEELKKLLTKRKK